MRSLLILLFLILVQSVHAQDFLPIDTSNTSFRKSLKDLYAQRVKKQEDVFKKEVSDAKIRKEVNNIYKEVSTSFMDLIEKGYFVKDSLYEKQLNAILDNLKKHNPEYKSLENTKILLSYGTSPNAYAIGNDIVVIYIPFLKKIKNQYQLAYILSHEVAHNILNHSYNSMLATAQLRSSEKLLQKTKVLKRKKYNRTEEAIAIYRNLIYGSSRKNRKLEHQADSLGFILYKNSYKDYEYEAVTSFEFLENIDEESDSLIISDYRNLFETEQFTFKKDWINNAELNSYKYDTRSKFWMIDSLKTHPDCVVRAEFLKANFKIVETEPYEASEEFKKMQFASKYNDILGLYILQEYGKSLYEALLLLKSEPKNSFLRNLVHQNLVRIQDAQKTYTLDRHLDRPHPLNSDSYNSFLNFIRELRRKELSSIINQYKV